jgi:hypothetical protein
MVVTITVTSWYFVTVRLVFPTNNTVQYYQSFKIIRAIVNEHVLQGGVFGPIVGFKCKPYYRTPIPIGGPLIPGVGSSNNTFARQLPVLFEMSTTSGMLQFHAVHIGNVSTDTCSYADFCGVVCNRCRSVLQHNGCFVFEYTSGHLDNCRDTCDLHPGGLRTRAAEVQIIFCNYR